MQHPTSAAMNSAVETQEFCRANFAFPSMCFSQEVQHTLLCPLQEEFHTVVLKGVRNISDTLENPPMKFLL
jgi:hypothetical protein